MIKQMKAPIAVGEVRLQSVCLYQEKPLITESDVEDLKYVDISGKVYGKVKRFLDILFSALGLAVLIVPMLVIALAVYIDDPGRVIFLQYRVGRDGKPFLLCKFRTMKMDTPQYVATVNLEHPEQYITRVGHFLRRTSLDEIPQLFNVLSGDMSLIGPRPLIAEEPDIHKMRSRFGVYSIRPGMTGLAQINGRDTVSLNEKVHYDVKYLENFGLWQDIHILLGTLPGVFSGTGIVEGCAVKKWEE